MLHPFLDGWIALVDSLAVTVLSPKHITAKRQGCCPRHIVAVVVPECWRYVRDTSVCALCLTNVTHPFCIETLVVEQERLTQRPHRPIAQPRLTLVTLRTVDRHSLIVVQNTPPGILHHFIQDSIRAFKMARSCHLVSHYFCDEIVFFCIFQSNNLSILKTMINECRSPPTAVCSFLAAADVNVCRAGIAEIVAI